ncbi:uncharacterized protein LOC123520713 [Portunus trituberculatus]|uniref:uncharacterized protein LOC123520713 n=1 Tax=Portunus trituberculatus TaxID=210409 RepID=UPI001E1CDA2F|nr:uncharacterized protein LOC123520713 [Portunus trituberculatus]
MRYLILCIKLLLPRKVAAVSDHMSEPWMHLPCSEPWYQPRPPKRRPYPWGGQWGCESGQVEYQPVLIGLRKGSVLTRHNLNTGRVYDIVNLGPSPTNTLAINYVADVLIIKSPRLFLASQSEHFFRFHVFQLHPFKHITTFDIESGVFPSKEHKEEFGKLRNAEIHDGLLLIMTEKNFNLIYDAEKIIQDCVTAQSKVNEVLETRPVNKVRQAPKLLFSTYAHLDILGLGGCPWTYIRALSDSVVECEILTSLPVRQDLTSQLVLRLPLPINPGVQGRSREADVVLSKALFCGVTARP